MVADKYVFVDLGVPTILPVIKIWNTLKSKMVDPHDMDAFASSIFKHLFVLEPGVSSAFRFGDENAAFKATLHYHLVGQTLDKIFSSLFEVKESLLLELGRRHSRYAGFHVAYTSSFALAILSALEQHLGRAWNARLKMRWERIVFAMMQKISAGAHQQSARLASTITAERVRIEALDIQDIGPVMDSWEIVKQQPNYREAFGELMFRKLFELAPEAPGLFKKGEAMYSSILFKTHSLKVMSTFDMVVSSLLDLEREPIVALGARHAAFGGIKVEHFAVLGLAVLATLELTIGNSWNDRLKGQWINVLSFLSVSMIEGMTSTRFL